MAFPSPEGCVGHPGPHTEHRTEPRWAAVEAAQHAWRPTNPWHQLYTDLAQRAGKNPAKAAVARKILIAAWHVLSRQQPFKAAAPRRPDPVSASSRCLLAA
jgi:hypothetical protein